MFKREERKWVLRGQHPPLLTLANMGFWWTEYLNLSRRNFKATIGLIDFVVPYFKINADLKYVRILHYFRL